MSKWTGQLAMRQVGVSLLTAASLFSGISCGGGEGVEPPASGNLEITSITTGPEPDADGYTLTIDSETDIALGPNATVRRDGLEPGSHTVLLTGMATNCTLDDNPRTINISAGETETVSLQLTCIATTGSLEITSSSSGPSPDLDGYSVTVDGINRGALEPTAHVTFDGLVPGDHQVGLSGVAGNCQAQGDNPRSVTVTAGATATTAFVIACVPPPSTVGVIRIATVTTGPNPDPDGYAFAIDRGPVQAIGLNDTATLDNISVATHEVALSGLAGNCSVQGSNPTSITVSPAATANVSFTILCTATTGSLEVSTATTGPDPDPDGYSVTVDNVNAGVIGATAMLAVSSLTPGPHTVGLAGLASNCTVEGENPQSIMVTADAETTVNFAVTCVARAFTWQEMETGHEEVEWLRSIWGSSATDVYAVGGSSVYHYDGQQWSRQHTEAGARLNAVWGNSPSDVFVVGRLHFDGVILHYDGRTWASMPLPITSGDNGQSVGLESVWGTSHTNVYAVGLYWDGSDSELILHFDGIRWSILEQSIFGASLHDIFGSSETNAFAVGSNFPDNGSFIRHWNGSQWSDGDGLGLQPWEGLILTGVWTKSPAVAFAVGTGDDGGTAFQYDGSKWSKMTLPRSEWLKQVWGTAKNDVYAIGDGLLHFDGTGWTRIADFVGSDVWGPSADEIFVLGNRIILHGTR